jgi:hypothetical protein
MQEAGLLGELWIQSLHRVRPHIWFPATSALAPGAKRFFKGRDKTLSPLNRPWAEKVKPWDGFVLL